MLNLYYFYDVSCPNNGSERVIGLLGNAFEELEEVKFKEHYRLSKNAVYLIKPFTAARGKLMLTIPC